MESIPGTKDPVRLVCMLLPARLIAVTLNMYKSHSVEFIVIRSSLLIVMVVEEVLNIAIVVLVCVLFVHSMFASKLTVQKSNVKPFFMFCMCNLV